MVSVGQYIGRGVLFCGISRILWLEWVVYIRHPLYGHRAIGANLGRVTTQESREACIANFDSSINVF